MLRVTKLADYGIVILTHLAGQGNATSNARDLAQEARLPLPVVSKILKLLAKDGLLESHRGIKGGYGLARKPEQITVSEIIRALEGPIAVTECTDRIHGDCGLETGCPVRTNWHLINQAIQQALEKITLAEMTQPLGRHLVNLTGSARTRQFQVL
ncbi:MAG: SUF system Fe-S cluster assembly regulator [Acidobacteriota bacterium]|jgi:FeS assembly SUF system regulator